MSDSLVIHMRAADVQLVPGQRTWMWTFDGTFPGPTIRAQSGHTLRIRYVNDLPAKAGSMTIHLHGDHHPSADDGQPDSYLIPPGHSHTYTYPLTEGRQPERAAFLWYHEHRMGESGRNVWNGLAGMFILDDSFDSSLSLPTGREDVPLMVTDRSVQANSQLSYSRGFPPPDDGAVGDHILVNGTYQPYLDVGDKHYYRLRLLNASNWCAYNFHVIDERGGTVPVNQIGTDGGLSPHVTYPDSILLGPGERADVLVSFAFIPSDPLFGSRAWLESVPRPAGSTGGNAPGTDSCRARDSSGHLAPIMEFRVTRHDARFDNYPVKLRPLPFWTQTVMKDGDRTTPDHTFHLGLVNDASGKPHWAIDRKTYDPRRIDAVAHLDKIVYWNFANDSPVTHYMHIHDTECVGGSRSFGVKTLPNPVLKDTFRVDPYQTIRIACRFTDYPGVYMIHCHMLEHEDNAMMAQFLLVGKPSKQKQIRLAEAEVARAATQRLKQAGWSWKDLRHKIWLLCHFPEVLPPGSHPAAKS